MEGTLPLAEMQSVYFTVPVDWARRLFCRTVDYMIIYTISLTFSYFLNNNNLPEIPIEIPLFASFLFFFYFDTNI